MKTNQMMEVCFPAGTLHIGHKTKMGSMTDLFSIGNKMRTLEGKTPANLTHFINSKTTQEFIAICMEMQDIAYEEVICTAGRGKSARTEANLHFLIYAAQYLSTKFHYQVIDTFINGKLLEWRDDSGDQFNALNLAIDAYLPDREGKDNKGIYIQVAKRLKEKLQPEDGNWNAATPMQLKDRAKIEASLVQFLKMGVVRDWNHLKELIEKV